MNTINTIMLSAAISALGGCDGPGEVAVPLDGVYPPIGEPPTVSLVESGTNPSPVRYEPSAVGAQAFILGNPLKERCDAVKRKAVSCT